MHRYPASGIGPLYNRYRYGIGLIGPFISGTVEEANFGHISQKNAN